MTIFLLLFSFVIHAATPPKWENAKSIVDRHEFYPNDEEITKPQDTWQVLFALTFLDASFHVSKDCVYYRVAGTEPGKLKIKTLPVETDCANEILATGDEEWDQVTALKFATTPTSATLEFRKNGKAEKWTATLMKDWKRPEAKLLLSSADFKSPRMIFLAPAPLSEKNFRTLKDGTLCHDISSDCSEKSASFCQNCENGWTEIPNGCTAGPKVCGNVDCGGKDKPACRRGMVWQRKDFTPDCRSDSSFAWCSKGLQVSCDGDRAYCR
ncbi:MAG: hypothetical protein ACJ76H_17425 [Bacteriovoracaceae bacterium]